MTRTVADAAIMLGAMAGYDKQDAITADAKKKAAKDYTKFLDPNGLKGARLGLVMQFIQGRTADQTKAYYKPFIDKIRDAGANVIDVTFTPDYSKVSADRLSVLLYEFKADLNKYLASPRFEIQDARGPDQIQRREQGKGAKTLRTGAFRPGSGKSRPK